MAIIMSHFGIFWQKMSKKAKGKRSGHIEIKECSVLDFQLFNLKV